MTQNLTIYMGNHLEVLIDALSREIRQIPSTPGYDPLQPEIILVQSKGMQRWISMALALRNGICANMRFPFPNAFLEEIYKHAFQKLPEQAHFSRNGLTFRIMGLLDDLQKEKIFAPIAAYLAEPALDLKKYQLSRTIADVFDQYLVFRPEMIQAWEQTEVAGQDPAQQWQALLWRRIVELVGNDHRTSLQKRLIEKLTSPNVPISGLPLRISVFGISHLPVFHLQVLAALSHRMAVNLFLLNPCRQYWADIISEQQLSRVRTKLDIDAWEHNADLHFEQGHRLLSSWGQQGRHFFNLTQQLEGEVVELFQEGESNTVLGSIQQDILDLVDHTDIADSDRFEALAADNSLQVHVCHSPMREIEVLHDQLLALLDSDATLHPSDILVMAPDIGTYTPYVHSVFGFAPKGSKNKIPYTVADQTIIGESRLVEGFLRLLDLKGSRFEISQVLGILQYETIRQRFGLTESELSQIEQWLNQVNVRWGWDGKDRQKHGVPRFEQNTWRAGLDRLIAGYAMDIGANELFAGVLPHEGIEGSDTQVLGNLISFAEKLYFGLQGIPDRAPLQQWPDVLLAVVETFISATADHARDLQVLRETIDQLSVAKTETFSNMEISFEAVRQYLVDNLQRATFGTGFISGGVTFCAMLPMRSIPAKVICLVGMQHDAFPQELHEPGFNLIAADPRPGDRSKRNDDKYLFLEAVISARQLLYISYIGRDIQDNSPKPPSVLVDELLEYVQQAYHIQPEKFIVEHPLQPFSPAYFDGRNPRLFSFSTEDWQAARSATDPQDAQPFFDQALPEPQDDWYECDITNFCAFFANPAQYLLQQRLGIYLRENSSLFEDRERFNIDPLSGFLISQSLFQWIRNNPEGASHFKATRAAGDLPLGTTGYVAYDRIDDDVARFWNIVQHYLPKDSPQSADLELNAGRFRLQGRMDGVYSNANIIYRMARLRSKDLIAAFLGHLIWHAIPQSPVPKKTMLICKDVIWEFAALAPQESMNTLQPYLPLYWEGLCRPLPFFCRTSYEYALKRLSKGKDRQGALADAAKQWHGSYKIPGESEDPYIHLCFKSENPLTEAFETLALQVFEPVLRYGQWQLI